MESKVENPRALALRLLSDCEKKRAYSNLTLKNAAAGNNIKENDAKLLYTLVNGVLEKRILLDYYLSHFVKKGFNKLSPAVLNILRLGVYQLLYLDKIPDSAACNESVKLANKLGDARLSGFINGVLRNIVKSKDNLPEIKSDSFAGYLSIKYSVPLWITDIFLKSYKDKAEDILKAREYPAQTFIRINNLKTGFEGLNKSLLNDCASLFCYKENTAVLKYSGNIEKLKAFKEGFFHVQGLSSQLCSEAVEPLQGEKILDMCSAPGGKAFTMAELSGGKASITAMDIHSHRVKLIEDGAERLGLTQSIKTVTADGAGDIGKNEYDRILCDVPCSGFGVIRKKPDIIFKTPEEIINLPDLQYKILQNGAKHLKIGGRIVYSTCTLNPLENENVIQKFVDNNQNFQFIDISKHIPKSIPCIKYKECVTILPDTCNDGFFIAVLQRVENI